MSTTPRVEPDFLLAFVHDYIGANEKELSPCVTAATSRVYKRNGAHAEADKLHREIEARERLQSAMEHLQNILPDES